MDRKNCEYENGLPNKIVDGNSIEKDLDIDAFRNDLYFINKTYNFHGIQCLISSKYDDTHYRLIALDGTTEQLQIDKSFTEYHEWGAIAVPIFCPSCEKIFWFDDTDVPIDRIYECECPNCKMLLKRRR